MSKSKQYIVYTDGSHYATYMGQDNVGGWSFAVEDPETGQIIAQKSRKVKNCPDNNYAELIAVIKAVKFMHEKKWHFTLKTDSKITLDGIKGKTMPRWHIPLWQELFSHSSRFMDNACLIPREENKADFAAGMAARSFVTQ